MQWLDDKVDGGDEVQLGKAVGKAVCVSCCVGDKKQTLEELARLTECDQGETEESRKVKGRVLVCAALFAQENKEVIPHLKEWFQNDIQLGTVALCVTESMQCCDVTPIAALFQRSSDMCDSFGTMILGTYYIDGDGVPRDKKKGVCLLKQAMEMGNVDAMIALCRCFGLGVGVQKDEKKVIELWQQAAELGNIYAMVELGNCYKFGHGIIRDGNKALELYRQAVDMGDIEAMLNLGICYKNDERPFFKKRAVELFEQAANTGYTLAISQLGNIYDEGSVVPQDEKKAIELCKRAAEIGDTNAIIRLAFFLKDGGCEQKDEMVTDLFQKHASKYDESVMCSIAPESERQYDVQQDQKEENELNRLYIDNGGVHAIMKRDNCFENGYGVSQNMKKAIQLLQLAASSDGDAMLLLGDLFYKGDGVPQNMKKAFEYYQKVAQTGYSYAIVRLAFCLKNGDGVRKDDKKANELFQRIVSKHNSGLLCQIASDYEQGNRGLQDKKKAIELYKWAADRGDTHAMVRLGDCYLKGDIVPKDKEKAFEWYQKAADLGDARAVSILSESFLSEDGIQQNS